MTKTLALLIPVLALFPLLSGCEREPPTTEPEQTMEQRPPPGLPQQLEPLVDFARQDLARRLEIPTDEIRLKDAESVTWRDGSLGCPEPGGIYTQALVPGYRIRLVAGDATYHYHGARDRNPRFCPEDRVVSPAPDGRETRY